MKILLLSANTETINMPVLPVGLASVAAACRQAGHETRLLNLMGQEDSEPVLKQAISGFSPDVIGISLRNIDDQDMDHTRFLAEKVKPIIACCRSLSRAPVVLGGAGYSIFPHSALDYLGADMGIRGEGEHAFVELVERLSRNAPVLEVPGLYRPKTGCRIDREYIPNLSALPRPDPDRDLPIPPGFNRTELWLPFQTRRGCPMDCSYCSTGAIEGRRIRKTQPTAAAEALACYRSAGFTRFFFVDNTFNLPPAYAEALCDAILDRRLSISWRAIVYPWKMTERLARKMAEAGCVEVSLGFESFSEPVLRSFRKRFGPADIRRAAECLEAQRIFRMGFLLLGGPGETRQTALESLRKADALGLESMKLTVGIRIYPETRLAETAAAEGVISPDADLLSPRFYVRSDIREWLTETASNWAEKRQGWFFRPD
jgi:radical SAM superfamily enzyme YgiQ (UPF0313 family)